MEGRAVQVDEKRGHWDRKQRNDNTPHGRYFLVGVLRRGAS